MSVQIDHGRLDIERVKKELEDRDRLYRIEVRKMIITAVTAAAAGVIGGFIGYFIH